MTGTEILNLSSRLSATYIVRENGEYKPYVLHEIFSICLSIVNM
jgi:hypothetical protein